MRRPFLRSRLSLVLAGLLAMAACTDRNPAGAASGPRPELPPSSVALLTCTATVAGATVSCRAPDADAGPGVSAAIIGGQGVNVRLQSSDASYDGTGTFRVNVALENLAAQALGTADGVTPSADGVRVFFSSGPLAAEGTGPVEVANADGEAFFLSAAQKYFRYDGILPPGDTTPAREWRFTVPPSVTRFTFGVYVAAPVRAETGWVSVSPLAPSLLVGDTMRITATVRNLAGRVQAGDRVEWTTSNAAVVAVDSAGLLTAAGAGTATVTAAGGGRTGSVQVLVYTAAGSTAATVDSFEVLGGPVTANGVDSLVFRGVYRGRGVLPLFMEVILRHPLGGEASCRINNPTLTDRGMEWRCGMVLHEGRRGGVWRVERVTLSNRSVLHAALLAAGADAHVYVRSPNQDLTAPTLSSLTFSRDTVQAGGSIALHARVADAGVGADSLHVRISSQGNPRFGMSGRYIREVDGVTYFEVDWTIPQSLYGGPFVLDSVWMWDRNDNRRAMGTAELAAAGFRTEFTVVNPNPDTVPPTITGFSFTPNTVAGNGADSVTVTLSASEPSGASGVWFLDMEFEKTADAAQRRGCLLNGSTRVFNRTMTCRLAFGTADAGTWRVRYVRAIDFMNQSRVLFTADLQAAGYPTALTVTPP